MKIKNDRGQEIEVAPLDLEHPCWFCKQLSRLPEDQKICCAFYDENGLLYLFKEDFKDIQPHQACLDARKEQTS